MFSAHTALKSVLKNNNYMPDLIRLLPDSVANQIAAGEVIQRPASAIKELLENAVDACATQIKLIIKDGGKTLIQVIDNGTGMSDIDARMCFERHATSKIREANDLFSIRTLGFRGEALASIAAIAQVELKTRKESEDIGTCVIIEGSTVKSQEPVATPKGTSFSIKNLFYNVPARRHFLKSDNVEYRHILEEFQRVALVNPDIEFTFYNNEKLVHQLPKGNLKQRIVHIFGTQMNEKLLAVDVQTEDVTIQGYIGRPENARKTRGEQYFFANGRYIRHPYLHHAVEQAFEELIPDGAIPSYFLFMDVNPSAIDVNIHPTKTEVNFQHGQIIYATLRSAVKHALGMFTLSPTIDFETEPSFQVELPKGHVPKQPGIVFNPEYNPFKTGAYNKPFSGLSPNKENWESLYEVTRQQTEESTPAQAIAPLQGENKESLINTTNLVTEQKQFIQIDNKYIITRVKSGLLVIDQQRALERIMFEKLVKQAENSFTAKQKLMFPENIQLSPQDEVVFKELLDDLSLSGFEFSDLGGGTYALNAVPGNMPFEKIVDFIDDIIEDYKKNKIETEKNQRVRLLRIMAGNVAKNAAKNLKNEEMQGIIDELFLCKMPEVAPDGNKVLKILQPQDLDKIIR